MTASNALLAETQSAAAGQQHLPAADRINLGAYYTASPHVRTVWRMLDGHVPSDAAVLDSACGYGGFLRPRHGDIGCDIDPRAIARARQHNPRAAFFCANALTRVSRKKFNIADDAPLVIVGNPPFNDRTSQIRRAVKKPGAKTDADICTRDLGISFLRSFDKLRADAVCVLHPLSYLIKSANFSLLGDFAAHYELKKAEVISSAAFADNSSAAAFPIVIALYLRGKTGMQFEDIRRRRFAVGGKSFAVADFDYVDSFLRKYPRPPAANDLAGVQFYPLRDINALRRNRTFIFGKTKNGVFIDRAQLQYYVYADVFKQLAARVPYYFGNSNLMIDDASFRRCRRSFFRAAARRHPGLKNYLSFSEGDEAKTQKNIEIYFRNLLGMHYVH